MTYNVFGETLNLALSTDIASVVLAMMHQHTKFQHNHATFLSCLVLLFHSEHWQLRRFSSP